MRLNGLIREKTSRGMLWLAASSPLAEPLGLRAGEFGAEVLFRPVERP
jgi:hypothetical protein